MVLAVSLTIENPQVRVVLVVDTVQVAMDPIVVAMVDVVVILVSILMFQNLLIKPL